ncbi:MAG: adenosylmethionine decarboxylase [Thermoproteota archaeon]
MECLGRQIIAELYSCDKNLLDNLDHVRNTLLDAALKANTRIIDYRFHRFTPQGVSGVVVIAESHIAIHTWPEYGYAALDIFTCGDRSMPMIALRRIVLALRAGRVKYKILKRGMLRNVGVLENKIPNS